MQGDESRTSKSSQDSRALGLPHSISDDRARAVSILSTVDEVAALLRTTRGAVYVMVARGQLPGITRIGRRVLFRTQALLDWLDQKRAQSPRE
jgi:excisionase family DNA binding protein